MNNVERNQIDLMNAMEHISAIMEDSHNIEMDSDASAATMVGFLTELNKWSFDALFAAKAIQTAGRKDGYNLDGTEEH